MWISQITILDYKGFYNSETIEFKPGFNIVTGRNNVGKTALLEALSLGQSFKFAPHRSVKTYPTSNSISNNKPSVEIEFAASGDEVRNILTSPGASFYIPLPHPNSNAARSIGYSGERADFEHVRMAVLDRPEFRFRAKFEKTDANNGKFVLSRFPTYNEAGDDADFRSIQALIGTDVTATRQWAPPQQINSAGEREFGLSRVLPELRGRIYYFRPERMNVGRSTFGQTELLAQNAANLPEVLGILQSQHFRYEKYIRTVREVLPQVRDVSVQPAPTGNNALEIFIWSHDPASERADLAVPLMECGTGISQVLSILYVAVTSDFPRTLIIDEPQSFLHPGAVRKLIEVLREFKQHQFIIGTHSPTAISASKPETITLLTQADGVSHLRPIDATRNDELITLLAEVGASLSDVFGADQILWVEGATEEICYPRIIEKLVKDPLKGVLIKGVVNTGDFEGRYAELILQVYEKLSGSSSLLPPSLAFLFDDEGRTQREKEELATRSGGKAFFLKRRMFENYLLNPEAISAVINAEDTTRDNPIVPSDISAWIDDKKERYGVPTNDLTEWEQYVNASKVLDDLFSDISETRLAFRKTIHSVMLCDWLLENSPDQLEDLAEWLGQRVADRSVA